MNLTKVQRQLLAVYPASMISDVIINGDGGISRIRAGCCGGSRLDGPIRHYNTSNGKIQAGTFGEDPLVVVTFAQLKAWAASVPAAVREKLAAVRLAQQEEQVRTYKWCHCPRPDECNRRNAGDPLYGDRHHPTEEEDQEHLNRVWELRDQERALLDEALGLDDEPVGQLDLFEELMGAEG